MTKPDSVTPNAADPVPVAPAGVSRQSPAGTRQESNPEAPKRLREIGGPSGPEPTRYGDWERNGRVSDF
jgi:homeobox protein ESX1